MSKELELVEALTAATAQGTVRWRLLETAGMLFPSRRFLGTLPTGRSFVLGVTDVVGPHAFRLEIRDDADNVESTMQASATAGDAQLASALRALYQALVKRHEAPIDRALEELKASRPA
jgi:hypothetical protein